MQGMQRRRKHGQSATKDNLAGWYDALRIRIGKAQGHNWWCVLYPNLCFMDSVHAIVPKEGKEELRSVLTDEEYAMIVKGTPVKIKWFFLQLTE